MEGVLIDLALDKFGYGYCLGKHIDQLCRNCVIARGLWHITVPRLFHRRIKDGTQKSFGQGSGYHGLNHRNHLLVRASFYDLARIPKEAYDRILYQT